MSTLAEIEAAADSLPLEQKRELIRFLETRIPAPSAPASAQLARGTRRFPVSRGREPITSEDVARIEAEAQ